jgi:hypothetical protein
VAALPSVEGRSSYSELVRFLQSTNSTYPVTSVAAARERKYYVWPAQVVRHYFHGAVQSITGGAKQASSISWVLLWFPPRAVFAEALFYLQTPS